MNSLTKKYSDSSINDFSDTDDSQSSQKYFVPQGKNLLQELSTAQFETGQKEEQLQNKEEIKNQQSSSHEENSKLITKDVLMSCIQNRQVLVHKKENDFFFDNFQKKKKQLSWQSNQKPLAKVTKINKKTKPKKFIESSRKKNLNSYYMYRDLYEKRLTQDNPKFQNIKIKNVLQEKNVENSTLKNSGQMLIQQQIMDYKKSYKQISEQTKKIQLSHKLQFEDVIDAFVLKIFKLQSDDQKKVILALKFYINNAMYSYKEQDLLEMTRAQILNRLIKLLQTDNQGQYIQKNTNLLAKFFDMNIILLKDIKSLILYLLYNSTKYLVAKDYSNAEIYLDLTDTFYLAFSKELNKDREYCCDIFNDDAQFDILDIYIQNSNNIKFFQAKEFYLMKKFDELVQSDQFNIAVFISKILMIFLSKFQAQNQKVNIENFLSTIIQAMREKKNQKEQIKKINHYL